MVTTTLDTLADIREKIDHDEPLSQEEGVRLYESPDIHTLGELANSLRERLHGRRAYYNINRHINYSNYCVLRCKFCSFYRPYPKSASNRAAGAMKSRLVGSPRGPSDHDASAQSIEHDGAYELSIDDIVARASSAYAHGATEVHIVGGLHPKLPFSFYTDMCSAIRDACPHLHIKAFTAIEIIHFSRIARPRLSIADVLTRLRDAGLGSLPGGGAEIFDQRVHDETYKNKVGETEWFDVHTAAHELGIFTNATMLYGHVETPAERVGHLIKLREHQAESLRSFKAHFNCVVPLSFMPDGSALSHLPGPSGIDDLKTLAISRLMCPNIEHIKAFWIMQTPKLAQVSLNWGVDDIDGTVVYYDITKKTPDVTRIDPQEDEPTRAAGLSLHDLPGSNRAASFSPRGLSGSKRTDGEPNPIAVEPPRADVPLPLALNDPSATQAPPNPTHQELSVDKLKRLIIEAGCDPTERDTLYRRVLRNEETWRIEGQPWSVAYNPDAS